MTKERDEQGRFKAVPRVLKRKKTCTKCGRYLYLRDFYKSKDKKNHPDGYDCRCKECRRKEKNEEYARNRKKPDGLFLNSQGQRVEHKGCSVRLHWTDDQIRTFKRDFPFMLNEDLAYKYECSIRTIVRRAREMGLEKDKAWLDKVWNERRLMAQRANKFAILHQDFTPLIEGGKPYRFTSENHPSRTASKEELTARLKKAWQTRKSAIYKAKKRVSAATK